MRLPPQQLEACVCTKNLRFHCIFWKSELCCVCFFYLLLSSWLCLLSRSCTKKKWSIIFFFCLKTCLFEDWGWRSFWQILVCILMTPLWSISWKVASDGGWFYWAKVSTATHSLCWIDFFVVIDDKWGLMVVPSRHFWPYCSTIWDHCVLCQSRHCFLTSSSSSPSIARRTPLLTFFLTRGSKTALNKWFFELPTVCAVRIGNSFSNMGKVSIII